MDKDVQITFTCTNCGKEDVLYQGNFTDFSSFSISTPYTCNNCYDDDFTKVIKVCLVEREEVI